MTPNTLEITADNFVALVLQAKLPILIDFTADWCPPCKMIAPYVEELALNYAGRLLAGSLDADAHPEIVNRYGVMGLPTLLLFEHGEPVQRIVGFMPLERLEARILPYLRENSDRS